MERMMMRRCAAVCCLIVWSISTYSQSVQFERDEWEAVVKKAQQEEKLIFIDGYTTWCEPCKMMDSQVFNRYPVGHFFNKNFVNYKMDMERGRGPIFAINYEVRSYPTFLFVTSDGTLVHKIEGYQHAEDLINLSQPALERARVEAAWKKRYDEGDRKPDFLYNYTFFRLAVMDGTHIPVVHEYLNTQENWSTAQNMGFIYQFVETVDSEMFRYMAKHQDEFGQALGPDQVRKSIDIMVQNKMQENPTLDEIEKLYLLAYPDDGEVRVAVYKMNYYQDEGDFDNYALIALDFYSKSPKENRQQLDQLVDDIFKKSKNPHLTQWMRGKVTKNATRKPTPKNMHMLATLQFQDGDIKVAKKTVKKALKIAKKSKRPYQPLETLMAAIKAA